jgi:1-deoxy-D-xylulose-5-phosphate reductoisomerase
MPRAVAMASPVAAAELSLRLRDTSVRVFSGESGILEGIATSHADVTVNAILGAAGLRPSLAVIETGRRLALANKETLVIAGEYVMARARECGCEILPVDSEHCAIHQSLTRPLSEVRRLWLTASGGPFFGYTLEQLRSVSLSDTLAHPTWKMGSKITVDSATLMNKGFEILEASHLFGLPESKISVVVHRESIIHSLVEYIDNAILAELSVPDMRSPVQYAIDYPSRTEAVIAPLDLCTLGQLSFAPPDPETFPLLPLAREAARLGGGMGAVLNAADEIAVEAHLKGEIPFLGIADTVISVFDRFRYANAVTAPDALLTLDREVREVTRDHLQKNL